MWIFGGTKTRVRKGSGESIEHFCVDCKQVTKHRSVEIKDSFSLYFVTIGNMASQGFQCTRCGETVEASQVSEALAEGGTATAVVDPSSPAYQARELVREIQTTATSAPRVTNPDAISLRPTAKGAVDNKRVEAELAALKKRAKSG